MDILKQTYLKIGPFPKEGEMNDFSIDVSPSAKTKTEWTLYFRNGFTGKNWRFSWTGKEKDLPQLIYTT